MVLKDFILIQGWKHSVRAAGKEGRCKRKRIWHGKYANSQIKARHSPALPKVTPICCSYFCVHGLMQYIKYIKSNRENSCVSAAGSYIILLVRSGHNWKISYMGESLYTNLFQLFGLQQWSLQRRGTVVCQCCRNFYYPNVQIRSQLEDFLPEDSLYRNIIFFLTYLAWNNDLYRDEVQSCVSAASSSIIGGSKG